jgi:hypothetical protein
MSDFEKFILLARLSGVDERSIAVSALRLCQEVESSTFRKKDVNLTD